jgi:hypothetical protein
MSRRQRSATVGTPHSPFRVVGVRRSAGGSKRIVRWDRTTERGRSSPVACQSPPDAMPVRPSVVPSAVKLVDVGWTGPRGSGANPPLVVLSGAKHEPALAVCAAPSTTRTAKKHASIRWPAERHLGLTKAIARTSVPLLHNEVPLRHRPDQSCYERGNRVFVADPHRAVRRLGSG